MLLALGSVAFVTLLERKLLGLRQIRFGPNKVSIIAVLQPIADGVKLLLKQLQPINLTQLNLFLIAPIILLVQFLLLWNWVIPWIRHRDTKYRRLILFILLGVGTYSVIMVGWSSTRNFSKLGRIRGLLQGLSFEVALVIVFIIVLIISYSFKVKANKFYLIDCLIWWAPIWILISLLEGNRAPFDLLEGERELIRGFNLELGALLFVFLFLREYGIVIIIRILLWYIIRNLFLIIIFTLRILFIRRCYPRVRYDSLIGIIWKLILPIRVWLFMGLSFFF